MPAGLQAWDAAGNLTVDLTTRLSRLVGIRYIGAGESGSVTVDASLGEPWAIPVPRSYPTGCCHKITISGGTISFAPNTTSPGLQTDADLYYGVR
ncbi:hypothetical protein ARC20_07610 [Stenotrophomonas panacihumi]|uniref:Uncharacterized protein n=1 Tax=Stenotrophomonas panacihumi TaxID=676599 RepID=A0A0R0AK06_9GAMM|nr:hypothetical protein [Stenotrophomonas panacihumi]KRG45381.1 hypothetical protein ARC20_07610 [Stenotrophomonas panacihumi]PTN54788.1 hypothetical protein C9J98_08820 [Stenotrophomonas panacihumi]